MTSQARINHLETCLRSATLETFELMCFSTIEPVGQTLEFVEPLGVEIEFGGDATGTLRLGTQWANARTLASSFLGEDETSLSTRQVEAVTTELTNVICGGMLTLFAPDGNFHLTSPEVYRGADERSFAIRQNFRLDTGEIAVSVHWDGHLTRPV